MKTSLSDVKARLHGVLSDPPACPHCTSADVRLSRRPSLLCALGVHRFRCRACAQHFYLRRPQRLAAQERYALFFDRQDGVRPDRQDMVDAGRRDTLDCGRDARRAPRRGHGQLPDFALTPEPEPAVVDLAPLDVVIAEHETGER